MFPKRTPDICSLDEYKKLDNEFACFMQVYGGENRLTCGLEIYKLFRGICICVYHNKSSV